MLRIKQRLIRLVAKRAINRHIGPDRWEASKGKVGVVIGLAAYAINNVLPEFGVNVIVPEFVIDLLMYLGFGTALYGIREAQERTEDEVHEIEAKLNR